jgi:hypothetical protein
LPGAVALRSAPSVSSPSPAPRLGHNPLRAVLLHSRCLSRTTHHPSVILQLLPTNGYGSPGVAGAALEIAGIAGTDFTVLGSPGLDAAVFDAFTYGGTVLKVQ